MSDGGNLVLFTSGRLLRDWHSGVLKTGGRWARRCPGWGDSVGENGPGTGMIAFWVSLVRMVGWSGDSQNAGGLYIR